MEFLIVIAMVLVNAIFAAYEIALASVSSARLQGLAEKKVRGAATALVMKDGIERSLAVVQLGITLVGLLAGATSGASASEDIAPQLEAMGVGSDYAEPLAIALVVVPLTLLSIILGELLPKLFALRHKDWVCLTLSPIMRVFSLSVWPIVWLLETSATNIVDWIERFQRPKSTLESRTEAAELQELRAIAGMARTSRLIGAREENIILSAARLANRPVREIMISAEHIRMLPLNASISESLIAAHLDLHTRFPVCEKESDPQTICGYVTFKDIVAFLKNGSSEPTLKGILRDVMSLAEDTTIASSLERLLKERAHIAIVRDKTGAVCGMITFEDIVEELVGDIQDEHDQLPIQVLRSGTGWIVGGGTTVARLAEIAGIEITEGTAMSGTANIDPQTTLSAWIIEQLGSAPTGSEVIRLGGLRFVVRKVRRQRVLEAFVSSEKTPLPRGDEPKETAIN